MGRGADELVALFGRYRRTPENYMGCGDPGGMMTDLEDDAWEAGYLMALSYALHLTNDEQVKHTLEEQKRIFTCNSEARIVAQNE